MCPKWGAKKLFNKLFGFALKNKREQIDLFKIATRANDKINRSCCSLYKKSKKSKKSDSLFLKEGKEQKSDSLKKNKKNQRANSQPC